MMHYNYRRGMQSIFSVIYNTEFNSLIAQLVEHRTVNPFVPGSSPGRGANLNPCVAQPGRAPGLGPGGRMFESCHTDQNSP